MGIILTVSCFTKSLVGPFLYLKGFVFIFLLVKHHDYALLSHDDRISLSMAIRYTIQGQWDNMYNTFEYDSKDISND